MIWHEDWQVLVSKLEQKKKKTATAASAKPNDTKRGFHRMSSSCVAWQISSVRISVWCCVCCCEASEIVKLL
jgi:hypothetical protein